jgi:hypothetical protein
VQRIYRKQKVLERKPTKNSPEAKSNKRSRENPPQDVTITSVKFKGRGFFVDRHGVLQCHCDNGDKGNMDTDGLNSHVNTGIHKKWEARRDEEQNCRARIKEVAAVYNGNLHREIHIIIKIIYFNCAFTDPIRANLR